VHDASRKANETDMKRNMMQKSWRMIAGVAVALSLEIPAFGGETLLMPGKDTPVMTNNGVLVRTRDDIASIIAQELSVGATESRIEAFFQRHSLPFSYNPDGNPPRYNSLSWITESHAISIVIYVDNKKRLSGSEVRDSYTGL
jgi:hypothetical protein